MPLPEPSLQLPGFKQYCLGQGLSITGTGLQCVLVPWYVYDQTKSALALTLVAVTTALSLFGFSPYGGRIADRYDRWTILIVSQWVALIQALLLGVIALTGAFNLWAVLALNFLAGAITAFEAPAREAFKLDWAGKKQLVKVLGLYRSVDFTAFVVGQALGGVLIASFSKNAATVCFLVNAASYLAALWALLAVRPQGPPSQREKGATISLMEGLRLVRSNRLLLGLMLQTAVVVIFCKRLDPLLPAFAEKGLNDVNATGWLKVAMVAGAILGGRFMKHAIDEQSQLKWSYWMLTALPVVLLVLFIGAREPISASLAIAFVAAVLLIQESCCSASVLCNTDPSMQGQMTAWRITLNWGLDFIMVILLGGAAALGGVCLVLITSAIIGGVVALVLWRSFAISYQSEKYSPN